jgi:hypothetical protein
VQRGENPLNAALEDGTVHVLLVENAEEREPIKKATVTIGGEAVKGGKGARLEATGIPVGEQELVVTSPGHLKVKQAITVSPGENEVSVTLDLTPEETYMRYYAAYRFGRFKDAYGMMHPEVRKHYSYKEYVSQEKDSVVLSIKLFGTKMMSKWRPPYSKITFRHVAAIDRAVRQQGTYGPYTDNYTQHWIPIKGRWYIVFDWRD